MATVAERRSGGIGRGAGGAARRGLWGVARLVSLATSIVVGLLVVGIVLVLLDANKSNDIVNWLLDAGRFLAKPFHDVFKLDGAKARLAANWGLAAVVYAAAGGLLARLLRR
jgi:hypothetical protein